MNNNNKKKDQFNDTTDAGTAVRWLPSARPRTTSRALVSDGRAEERLDSFLCFVSFFSKKNLTHRPSLVYKVYNIVPVGPFFVSRQIYDAAVLNQCRTLDS